MRHASLIAVLAGCDDGGATTVDDPTTTATLATTTTATAEATAIASATATPSLDPADLEARLREIEAAVVEIRGLEPGPNSARTLVDGEQIADRIAAELTEPAAVEELAREERLLRLLGLLPPDVELEDVYSAYLGQAVLGLYDPATGELLVRADGAFDTLAEVTYAHEFTHELQDEHFDLLPLIEGASGDRDAAAALSALIEGDASAVQYTYMLRHLDAGRAAELLDVALGLQGELPTDTPPAVQAAIEFPYLAGLLFAIDLRASAGLEGLDGAYADPPTTTEQILHPEKYLAREGALPVELPDLAAALGAGWTVEDRSTIGELTLRSWLDALGLGTEDAANLARAAAAGWGGDAYVVLRDGDGHLALAARMAWDDPDDAAEFADRLADVLDAAPGYGRMGGTPRWDGPAGVLGLASTLDGATAIAVAPTGEAVDALLAALQ